MAYKKIESVAELKRLAKDDQIDCFIALMGGGIRSSKNVYYDSEKKVFSIINEVDWSEDTLTAKELYTHSNIGEAIDKGAFYLYD